LLADQVGKDGLDDGLHAGRDDDDGNVVSLAPLVARLEAGVEGDVCFIGGKSRALSVSSRVHVHDSVKTWQERLTLDEVLPDVFERVSVLADTLEHLGESVPVPVHADQQILSPPRQDALKGVPEGLVVVQDIDVELSSAVDAEAELVMCLSASADGGGKVDEQKTANSRHPWPCRSSPGSASSSRQDAWR
jgi:hypothetical protein